MSDHKHDFSGQSLTCRTCGADALAVASGAWTDGEPRAQTADELRDRFMDNCRNAVDYWASTQIDRDTVHERLSGLLHSLLCVIDGTSMSMPAFDLTASPHPDDKAYHQAQGENWIEPGTVINADDLLHEILYHHGAWAGDREARR